MELLLSRYFQSKYSNALEDVLSDPMIKTLIWKSDFKEEPSADSQSAPGNSLQNPPSNDSQSLLGKKLNNLKEIPQIMLYLNSQKETTTYVEVASVSQTPSSPDAKPVTAYDYFTALPVLITALAGLISALTPLIIGLKTNSEKGKNAKQ